MADVPNVAAVVLFLAVGASLAHANPESDVRAAVRRLREAEGYAWETTARQHATEIEGFAQGSTRLEDQRRVVEVRGRTAAGGYTEIVLPPSAGGVSVPVRAFILSSVRAVAWTPLGWMTRQEMRDSPRRGETMEFEGERVPLSRLFAACTRATNVELPGDELLGLVADVDEFEAGAGESVGRLHPGAVAVLREGGRRAASMTGEVTGRVIFRIRDGVVHEYEVRLESEVPRAGRSPIRRVERWTTTVSEIGSVAVDPPGEVVEKLERAEEE